MNDESDAVLQLAAAIEIAQQGRDADALAAFDRFLARHRDATGAGMRRLLSLAQFNQARALAALGREDDALAAFETLMHRYGADDDLETCRRCTSALLTRSLLLHRLGRGGAALAACDELTARYATHPDAEIRATAAQALTNKAAWLSGRPGRRNAWTALWTYRRVRRLFQGDPSPEVRVHAAQALLNKATWFSGHRRDDAALLIYEALLERCGTESHSAFAQVCSAALHNMTTILLHAGRNEEALDHSTALLERFGRSVDPQLRPQLAGALLAKANALRRLGRLDDARVACESLVEQYGRDPDLEVRECVKRAIELGRAVLAERPPGVTDPADGSTNEPAARDSSPGDPAPESGESDRTFPRDLLMRLTMQSLADHCTKHADFGEETVSAAAIARHVPGESPAIMMVWAGPPEATHDQQLDGWLRDELEHGAPNVVMLGRAHTARGRIDQHTTVDIVRFEFEDGSGRFYQASRSFEKNGTDVVWGRLRPADGIDRTPRVWPRAARMSWPVQPSRRQALAAGIDHAEQKITTYLRTGASLFALDDGIEILSTTRDRYEMPQDEAAALTALLSRGHLARYLRIGDPSDLASGLDGLRDLLASATCPDELVSQATADLITALIAEFDRTADPIALDEAIDLGTRRLDELGADPLNDPLVATSLGRALIARRDEYGIDDDVLRAGEVFRALATVSWDGVAWGPEACDLTRLLSSAASGPQERTLQFAGNAYLRAADQERGYGNVPFIAAYAAELVIAHQREANPGYLEDAVNLLIEPLDIEEPDLTPRLTWSSPYRRVLLRTWSEALREVRDVESLATRFDPDAERLLRALEDLVQFAPDDTPAKAQALWQLGHERARRGDLPAQRDALVEAMSTWESTFATSATVRKLGAIPTGDAIYSEAAVLHHELMREADSTEQQASLFWDHLAAVEATKSRIFTESISRAAAAAPADIARELTLTEADLLSRLTAIDNHDLAAESAQARIRPLSDARARAALVAELHDVWRQIESAGPAAADWVRRRRGRPMNGSELASLLERLGPRTACVSVAVSGNVILDVVCPGSGRAAVVPGPDVPLATTADLMWRELATSRGQDRGQTWLLDWARVIELLASALPDEIERLVVSPQGAAHSLAWPAIVHEVERLAGRELTLVLEPTLGVLRRRASRSSDGAALVIGNPLGDLRFAAAEADAVADLLGVDALHGADATTEAVVPAAARARIVHLATHAAFDEVDPLRSAIQLADGRWSARQLLESSLSAELVVLSACESGRTRPLVGDELAGLSMALLQAGAARVITTLWPVNDEASALFMTTLYGELEAGAECAVAMRTAAVRVRSTPGYQHPYFWAGYILLGDPQGTVSMTGCS